jgi:soluble lytic murein transglycosylase-like protein
MTTDEIKLKVIDYANGAGIYPEIALAQINRESGFNPGAVGVGGEHGLAQILPATWPRFAPPGVGFDLAFDVDYNLSTWAAYLSWLLTRYSGDYTKALQAYNGGEGHVDNGTVSSGAKLYASAVIAQANGLSVPNDSASAPGPGADPGAPQGPDWQFYLLAGGLAFALIMVLRK